jgi:RNA polymerase sigma-70 factor (ECF subfamily)
MAFLRIIKRFSDLGEISCPRTKSFCVIICRNISLDILRRSKKNADIPLDDTWNRIPGGKLTEDEAISDINAEIITSRILSLPNIYRDVFLLYYSNGYSVRQIAKALGISYDAAKKRLQRAKMVLNQYLRKEGIV